MAIIPEKETTYLEKYGVTVNRYLTYAQIQQIAEATMKFHTWAERQQNIDMLILIHATDMTVEEMSHCRPCIPMNGYHYHRGCANPAWLRVLIMTQADGSYKADGSIHFRFKKHRKIDRCKHLLRQAEIMFVVHNYIESTAISIPARAVPLWLRQFRTKTFGYWLLD